MKLEEIVQNNLPILDENIKKMEPLQLVKDLIHQTLMYWML